MWSVVNLVDRFSGEFDFYIVTRNHDLAETSPYKDVEPRKWNSIGNAEAYYFESGELTAARAAQLTKEANPDIVYLNSTFSLPVLRFLAARRKGLISDLPVVLSPCGEMSKAALSIKPLKKKLFLAYAKAVQLYRGVIWKASFEADAQDIRTVFGKDLDVMTAPDLAPRSILPDFSPEWKPKKVPGKVRFAYLSRISPKKNLAYLLTCLKEIDNGEAVLEIIGPIDDEAYWRECRTIIDGLPPNVSVSVAGALPNNEAVRRLAESHYFVLPTLNENFGYVFIEALAAGCPLLTSDNTVWADIEDKGIGWAISLGKRRVFLEQIKRCVEMSDEDYAQMSQRAREYAEAWLSRSEIDEATARVLSEALSRRPHLVADVR